MIAVFIKIPFLPMCSKFTSDAFSQGALLKQPCSPQTETLPQRVQRFLPRRHANRLPFHQSVCRSPAGTVGTGRSRSGRSLGLRQQSAVRLFPVPPPGAQRPGPGEAGRREAPVLSVHLGPGTSVPASPGPRRPGSCMAPPGGRGGRRPAPELPKGCSRRR